MGKSVVGVRFKKVGKIYYFDPLDIEFDQFDPVIVETVRGIEYGEIALTARVVDEEEMVAPVKPVIRKATESDTMEFNKLKQNEQDAKAIFIAKAKKHKLEMKLIDV
ncbi:MAG: stage 0 sporulation protein, partial [Firmicutes bacterium]|nr:stage 0 sporulation protein [Bacillota bacterium]